MKLTFFKPGKVPGIPAASLNRDGKLHFSSSAIEKYKLNASMYFKVGADQSKKKDKSLYLIRLSEKTPEAFKVTSAGRNMYLATKPVFAAMNIDHVKKKLVYSVAEFEYEGQAGLKLSLVEETARG